MRQITMVSKPEPGILFDQSCADHEVGKVLPMEAYGEIVGMCRVVSAVVSKDGDLMYITIETDVEDPE